MLLVTTLLSVFGSIGLLFDGGLDLKLRGFVLLLAIAAAVLAFLTAATGGPIFFGAVLTQIVICIGVVIYFGIDQLA